MTELGPPGQLSPPASGLMTFLIADVRGYTRFTLAHGDEAAARLATRFAQLTQDVIAPRGGHLLELRGDEALVVFPSARQALRGAVEMQIRFAAESSDDLPLRVGIGLDAGEAVPVEGGFRGAALNLAARLCSLAGPGEVLASDTITNLARRIDGLEYADRGTSELKGFEDPVHVMQILPQRPSEGSRRDGPPAESSAQERPLPIGGFLGALPPDTLVARDAELARLLAMANAVQEGRGRLVLLSGEPGVGKTRLAQEVTVAIRNRSFMVATGRCYEPHQAVPFYPFLEAIHTARVSAPPEIRQALSTRWPYLARLLPDLGLEAPRASNAREEQQRLFWAVTDFLQALAEHAPVAVLLDDLHWADSPTLELLQYVAEHTAQSRLLLVGTYRQAEVDAQSPLQRTILDLERERLVDRISLDRLGADDTARLIASIAGEASVDPELAQLVYRRTEGNAFFTQEIVRSLIERGDVYRANGEWTVRLEEDLEIPDTVRSVVAQRVSRLPEEVQETLREASVLGQTFSFDDLQELTQRDEDAVDRALSQAIEAGLVREIDRDRYTFNHGLTQHALYRELSSRRRRRLHQTAGETLLRLPEARRQRRVAELARHFVEAGDDERALPFVLQVGDQAAAAWSHRDAALQYRRALDLAERLGDTSREAEIYERLGGLLTASIRYPEALAMLERAAERYQSSGDGAREGRVVAQIGRVHLSKGSVEEGTARVRALLDSPLMASCPSAVAALGSSLAKLLLARGLIDETLERARVAEAVAREIGDGGLLSEATITLGTALLALGRLSEALEYLEGGRRQSSEAGDLFGVCRALQKISHIHLLRGDLVLSQTELEQARDLAERMDNQRQIATTTYSLGMHAFIAGDLATGREACVRAGEVIERLSASWNPAFHLGGLALVELAQGRSEEAATHLRAYRERSEQIGDMTACALADLALDDLSAGRLGLATDRMRWTLLRTPSEGYGSVGPLDVIPWAQAEGGAAGGPPMDQAVEAMRVEGASLVLAMQRRTRGEAT